MRWSAKRTTSPPRTPARPAAQPGRDPAVPATRAAALWHLRAAAGVHLVEPAGLPPYRCRHGYTSATRPDPARPKNPYIREDQILPRLAAPAILHAGDGTAIRQGARQPAQITAPAQAADLIDQLRAGGVSLIYDPATKSLSTDASDAVALSVG